MIDPATQVLFAAAIGIGICIGLWLDSIPITKAEIQDYLDTHSEG